MIDKIHVTKILQSKFKIDLLHCDTNDKKLEQKHGWCILEWVGEFP